MNRYEDWPMMREETPEPKRAPRRTFKTMPRSEWVAYLRSIQEPAALANRKPIPEAAKCRAQIEWERQRREESLVNDERG